MTFSRAISSLNRASAPMARQIRSRWTLPTLRSASGPQGDAPKRSRRGRGRLSPRPVWPLARRRARPPSWAAEPDALNRSRRGALSRSVPASGLAGGCGTAGARRCPGPLGRMRQIGRSAGGRRRCGWPAVRLGRLRGRGLGRRLRRLSRRRRIDRARSGSVRCNRRPVRPDHFRGDRRGRQARRGLGEWNRRRLRSGGGGCFASASPACTGATSLTKRAVAAAEGSRSGGFEALSMKAKLTPAMAAAASATPPAISLKLRELSLVDFCRAGRARTNLSRSTLTGVGERPCSRPGELDLAAVDTEGGAPGASVEASTTRFNSASMS